MAVRAAESGTRDYRRKFVKVLRALEDRYGKHIYPEERTLLEQAIFALMAYDNPVTNARKALRDLKDDFVDWNECRCATPREIEAVLERTRIEPKEHLAESIIELLQRAFQEFCQADLECLRTDPPEKTRRFLQRLEAAETGRKHLKHRVFAPWEVQYVELAAGLDPAPPVDPATDRVCLRLGVLPAPGPAPDPAKRRKALEALAPSAEEALRLHHLLAEHGKKVCHESDMKCAKCIVQEDCDWFRAERTRKKAAPAGAAAKGAAGAGTARKAAKGAKAAVAGRDGRAGAASSAKPSARKAAAGTAKGGSARAAKGSRRRSDDEE